MPFTTSHPAIILPLKQIWPRYFSLSGLMAGAMSPDLLYFLMMGTTERSFSHSWPGLFLFCLPAGVAFAFAFHRFFKRPFLTALPSPLDRLFSGLASGRFQVGSRRAWAVLIVSVLVGALSHFFWDAWTHAHGTIASRIPVLLSHVSIRGRDVQVTTILQYTSTLLGAGVIFWYLVTGRLIPSATRDFQTLDSRVKWTYWLVAASGSAVFVALALQIWAGGFGFWTLTHGDRGVVLRALGLGSWAGFFWTSCAYGLFARPSSEVIVKKDSYARAWK